MKSGILFFVAMIMLSGCGAVPTKATGPEDDMTRPPGGAGFASAEELRVYIDEVQPEPLSVLRYEQPFRWKGLNGYFAITEGRSDVYLIEMSYECKALVSNDYFTDMVDVRTRKSGLLRARVDTIRGCRIKSFYKLPAPAPALEPLEEDETDDLAIEEDNDGAPD